MIDVKESESAEILIENIPGVACLARMIATDNSMSPTINKGDIILIETSCKKIVASHVYVLTIGGQLMVRRADRVRPHQIKLDNLPENSISITADNPFTFKNGPSYYEESEIQVHGRVTMTSTKL